MKTLQCSVNGTVTVKLDGKKTHHLQLLVECLSEWPLGPIFIGTACAIHVGSDDQHNSIFFKASVGISSQFSVLRSQSLPIPTGKNCRSIETSTMKLVLSTS